MTNEQTLIVLRSLRARIVQAIDAARESMPDDAPRCGRYAHKDDNVVHAMFCSRLIAPAHYEYREDGEFVALMAFNELLDSIDADIAALNGEKVEQ